MNGVPGHIEQYIRISTTLLCNLNYTYVLLLT